MARSRRRSRRSAKARSYGIVTRNNPFPLIPIVGAIGLVGTGYLAYKAYDVYNMLTRPAVLVGTGLGAVIGYKQAKGFFERLAYISVGTGMGLLFDKYVLGGEE
jgi:hypothetical protein